MTDKELDIQLKALSEKANRIIKAVEDIGDGSVYLIPEDARIRISKHDYENIVEQFKLKYGL